jgi:nitroreductase
MPLTEYPNHTLELLIERSSCRAFTDKKIPAEVLEMILEAGVHAASGGNLQPFTIIKIEDNLTKQRLVELNENQTFIAHAPVNLLFCIDWCRLKRWAELEAAPFAASSSFRHFWISFQDTIIAAQNICSAADSLGLGSVYVGTVLECFRELRDMFELPKGVFPVVLLSLGYPKSRPAPKSKLAMNMLVHNERYQQSTDEDLLEAFKAKYPDMDKEITDERIAALTQVSRQTHGDEFARRCISRIRQDGHINAAQYYFGLHYPACVMADGNDTYLEFMEEFGFAWFKKYEGLCEKPNVRY